MNKPRGYSAKARYDRGMLYFQKSMYKKAIDEFTEAITIAPNFSVAYYKRGLSLLRLRYVMGAKNDFSEAEKLGFSVPKRLMKTGWKKHRHRDLEVEPESQNSIPMKTGRKKHKHRVSKGPLNQSVYARPAKGTTRQWTGRFH